MVGFASVAAFLALWCAARAQHNSRPDSVAALMGFQKRLFLLPHTAFGQRQERNVPVEAPAQPLAVHSRFAGSGALRRRDSAPAAAWRSSAPSTRRKAQRSRQCYFTPVQCVLYVGSDQYEQLVKAVPYQGALEAGAAATAAGRPREPAHTTADMLQQWRRTEAAPMLRGYLRRSAPAAYAAFMGQA